MKKKNLITSLLLVVTTCITVEAQTKVAEKINAAQYKIAWQKPYSIKKSETEINRYLYFLDAVYSPDNGALPSYSKKIELENGSNFSVQIINPTYQLLTDEESGLIKSTNTIPQSIVPKSSVLISKKKSYGMISFVPLRKNISNGKIEKLISFDLIINSEPSGKSMDRSIHTYADHSVLQSGKWYKFSVYNDGIYKITHSFLQSLGMDVNTVNPQNLRVYGNAGGMLKELSANPRPDDLIENSIFVQGESDGMFDAADYILFYGKGANTWNYNASGCPKFTHSSHMYSDSAYYFITADLGLGKRIQNQNSSSASITDTVNSFDDYAFHEVDNTNFIKSGRQWFGEYFDNIASYNFSFSFPSTDLSSTATVKANIASQKSSGGNASYSVSCQSGSVNISIIPASGDTYAYTSSGCFSFTPSNSTLTVNVTKNSTDAVAWLDYIDVNVRRQLTMNGAQMMFRDMNSVGPGNVVDYHLTSSSVVRVWDITNPTNVLEQQLTNSGANYSFVQPSDSLKQFISFNSNSFYSPVAIGQIPNQDLHGIGQKNLLIISHPDFLNEATQLANFHESVDTLTTLVVTPQQIYNEFSSGSQDATAIRDFVKMFYDRATSATEIPKYLILFGDGSYDNKRRFSSNTDFIPTYQSPNSTSYTGSYVSDDFYGCLDDDEGSMIDVVDAVDIGVGRIPVKTKTEAQNSINKIFYYTKKGIASTLNNNNTACSAQKVGSPFGDWRNMLCFIADDEDGDLHITQANHLATQMDTSHNDYNIDKIYFDAYQQIATPGGERYPGVSDAINKRVEKGCLIMNYTGHGGEVGLAHERVLEVSQINSWTNINNMPLFFTATCELSRWDDPGRTSAGEYMYLNPDGGGIALFTTVREAYAGPNFNINTHFYDYAFTPINGAMPRLGDIYVYIKNTSNGNDIYGRNFTLMGDPAIRLAYPKYEISTDTINATPVTSLSTDTLRALSAVSISGFVRDGNNNIITNYNGVLYPTVYDKAQNITTLSNDGVTASPPFTFSLQKNILYKGKVSVTNGFFKFSFIVPKDIAYVYGKGRISYYAENGTDDANGFYEKAIIGGSYNGALTDVTGPIVNLFLNDNKFVFGGMTNENPDLYSVLKDENGINTVGNGIGHDITAVLDRNTNNSIVLNDYYQSDLNSYKSGSIRYPFNQLSEGKHTLNLKVWDVFNNSSDSYTEFIVSKSAELALSHVLNYPNPFTTKTQFYFEQNQCCQTLNVEIQIYTISGKIVKTLNEYVSTEGFRSDPINWDGRDDYGDRIGRGVYVYKIKVKNQDGSSAEKFEKLVILN